MIHSIWKRQLQDDGEYMRPATNSELEFWQEIESLRVQLTIAREAVEVVAMIEAITIREPGADSEVVIARRFGKWLVWSGKAEAYEPNLLDGLKSVHAALCAAVEQRRAGK